MLLVALVITFVFVGEVVASEYQADQIAMDTSPWLSIVDRPVLIMLTQVRRRKIILRNLNDLNDECDDGDQTQDDVKELAGAHVLNREEDAGEHEPDVVGQIPGRLNTEVLLAPWEHIVDHEDVEHPGILAAMSVLELVEAWTSSSEEDDEGPKEEDQEDVKG